MKNGESVPGERLDTLSGDFLICQPVKGQRYSTDDMLAAWLAVRSAKERIPPVQTFLDLGSGLCSVPMIFLWAFPEIKGCGIEISCDRMHLGQKSLEMNGLLPRFDLFQGDIREKFLDKKFRMVTSSPPYYKQDEGPISANRDKAGVRFEMNGTIFDYFKSAACHLEKGGSFITVYPFQYVKRVFDAAEEHGFSSDLRVDVIPRQNKPPLISLFRFLWGTKGQNLTESLAVRNEDQSFTEEYKAVRRELGF